jgi:hypothetical protein
VIDFDVNADHVGYGLGQQVDVIGAFVTDPPQPFPAIPFGSGMRLMPHYAADIEVRAGVVNGMEANMRVSGHLALTPPSQAVAQAEEHCVSPTKVTNLLALMA